MASRVGAFLRHAWNVFTKIEDQQPWFPQGQVSYSHRPDRLRTRVSHERSIIASVYTRMAMDFASVDVKHVRLDEDDRYLETIDSGLNSCLNLEANLDQAATQFRMDFCMSLFEDGVVALVPVDTTVNPNVSSFDIKTMRVARIINWWPDKVRVNLYNQAKGRREDITLDKKFVAIVENPLYAVMNEPNSTYQRLIRKLNMLDAVDEQSSSGKLDLIIQLPYVVRSETRKTQAEQRRKEIEFQLKGSQYGIAYTDGTEKITQLNRPAENNLWQQVKDLTDMLYTQLGITPDVMNGTADEKTMLNYINRTIEPLLTAFVESMRRAFLTKTARTQKQSIMWFRDPFKFVTVGELAEIADKFSRNKILSPNEIRQAMGIRPSKDPEADKLQNANMPAPSAPTDTPPQPQAEGDSQNGA